LRKNDKAYLKRVYLPIITGCFVASGPEENPTCLSTKMNRSSQGQYK